MQEYISYNQKIVKPENSLILPNNRAFRYGDAIFESVRYTNKKVQFLNEHLNRLAFGIKVLKMQHNELINESNIENIIFELIEKNNISKDARIRITVFRNSGGLYTPEDNSTSFIIETFEIKEQGYELNFKGLTVDIFSEYKKQQNSLSNIKSGNSLLYVLAGIYKTQMQLDDCILLNDNNHIIESINSNIFAVKNGVLYTPPVSEGCVDGVMRKKIIEIAQANRIAVYEIAIMQNVLLSADELFLTNATQGMRWIVAYKQKRYFNNTAKKLTEKLNELVLN